MVKKYNKAKKVKYSEYKGEMLWSEEKQRYFRDKEELMEQYESDAYDFNTELSYPKWCFGCFSEVFHVSMDSAVESAIDETFEDFDRETHIVDLDELENFMDKWNKKQVTRTYFMDYATVILLDE